VAPAARMGDASKVKVKVLRLLDTARQGLQETASPAQATKFSNPMLITDDECPPENCTDVLKYPFSVDTGWGRLACILLDVLLMQPIEDCVVMGRFGLLEQTAAGLALDQPFEDAPATIVVVSIGLAKLLVRDVGQR
jgi:hypothetical protein